MKKRVKMILILLIILLSSCRKVTEYEAEEALVKHLKERYKEEFNIGFLGRRSDDDGSWYEADIYPKKYEGTEREKDRYYHRKGTVSIKKGILGESIERVGDTYRIVLMNESANNFYLPKLRELFGENVLAVLDINIAELPVYPEFLRDIQERMKEGGHPQIKGGIYIFGRVENDKDREWYRKQIYEFVQFMKQTGTFEYVDLGIVIWDERVLSEEFRGNEELRKEILVARNTLKSDKEFIKERKKIMERTNESMKKITKEEKEKVLNSYIKSDIYGENNIVDRIFSKNYFLSTKIYSPKYIESQGLRHREKTNYEKIEDVKFWSELY